MLKKGSNRVISLYEIKADHKAERTNRKAGYKYEISCV